MWLVVCGLLGDALTPFQEVKMANVTTIFTIKIKGHLFFWFHVDIFNNSVKAMACTTAGA